MVEDVNLSILVCQKQMVCQVVGDKELFKPYVFVKSMFRPRQTLQSPVKGWVQDITLVGFEIRALPVKQRTTVLTGGI